MTRKNLCPNEKKEFEFNIPRIKIKKMISSVAVEERKRLGINKSTLCHIKKNLSDRKTSKIYEKVLLQIQ